MTYAGFHDRAVHGADLFRPPINAVNSCSSSGFLPTLSTPGTETHTKRKRNHDDISRRSEFEGADGRAYRDVVTTPGAAANSLRRNYLLAGDLSTPNFGPSDHGILGESMYSDSDYRRALGTKRQQDDMDMDQPGPTQIFRLPAQPQHVQGWGSVAFATLGGVVGRVWQFCTAGAFNGFQAGDGKNFDMGPGSSGAAFEALDQDYFGHHLPGRYPQEPCQEPQLEDSTYSTYNYDSRASTPTRPAAKRRQTGDNTDDLGRNWVMVNDPTPVERPTVRRQTSNATVRSRNERPSVTTGRRISTPNQRLSTPNGAARRTSSRVSQANAAALNPPRPASSASYASPRSPSPSKIPVPSIAQNNSSPLSSQSRRRTMTSSFTQSSFSSHRRSNSAASAASNRADRPEDVRPVDASPRLDAEAKRLAARRKLEARDSDFRMSAFNKQVEDLIRQGKEALGTTIEVDGDPNGWEDED